MRAFARRYRWWIAIGCIVARLSAWYGALVSDCCVCS
jgi:hypothetical protein